MEYSLLGHTSQSKWNIPYLDTSPHPNGIFLTGTHLPIQWNIPYLDTSPHPNGIFLTWTHIPIQMEYPLLGHISPFKYNILTGTHLPIEMEYRLLGHISPIEMENPLLRQSPIEMDYPLLGQAIFEFHDLYVSLCIWKFSTWKGVCVLCISFSFRERKNSKKRADHFVSIPFQTPSIYTKQGCSC